jgi:NAD(P)-dependent dehydrogenase (short-subunit alcohol dehydrogenase family)
MAGIADLDGKVAVVTGGASGIGLGIARRLAAAGANVVIGDVEAGALDAAAAELGAVGVRTDVRERASVQALADAAVERFGTVNVVVNNAGVGPFGRLKDLQEADWRWVVDVNLWGVIHGVSVFLPILQDAPGGGHIVNTASMAGLRPGPNLGAYTVTKYGVVGLTESLAIELEQDGSQVGVTVLCPGPVHSNIGTSTRNRPESLAGALRDAELQMTEGRTWMQPDEVGDIVIEAIRGNELYAVTHPAMFPPVQERFDRITAAFEKRAAAQGA